VEDQQGLGIAVIGMSCAYPGAPGPDAFWHNIVTGVESLTRLSTEDLLAAGEDPDLIRAPEYVPVAACLDDVDLFDAEFFGFTPRDAQWTDPQHRLFLEHCWRAVESAGYDPRRIPGPVGVYAGQGPSTYVRNVRSQVDWDAAARAGERWEQVGALESDVDYLAPKVSYHLGLSGPSIPIGTACSTSLVAVHLACQALRTYECDAALAGGIAITPPVRRGYLYLEGGISSADGHTRTFDASSTGTVFGSGVGVVLLKRLEDALADGDPIEGVIIGSAINNDGAARAGFSTPSVDGQADVIAQAQAVAGVHPDTITYLEAHGTGTPVGDPIEVAALTRAFREHTDRRGYCVLGSVKANIGHMDTAAGVAGLIKALRAVKEGEIPPQLNFSEPNTALRLAESPFRITTEREPWRTANGVPRRAGVSSFGIGGTNAHVVVEQPPTTARAPETPGWHVLPVSARDEHALGEALGRLADTLERGSPRLDDTAHTLRHGRTRFACRAAVAAPDVATAVRALRERQGMPFPSSTPGVGFLFPGQGAQYPGMAKGLYDGVPEFAAAFDRCADAFRLDLHDIVFTAPLDRTRVIQPALFAVEYSLAQALIARGVRPAAMLGHSIGEFVAAAVAGVFTLADAARVIEARARFMDAAPPGAMLSVPLPASEVDLPDGVTVAAYNGPRLVTLAGPRDALDELATSLDATCRILRVPHAMHSPAMAGPAAEFAAFMATIPVRAPEIPYVSNVTGTWITEEEVRSPEYWGRQMREPVLFAQGMATLVERVDGTLVEAGPGRGLSSLALGAVAGQQHRLVQTLRNAQDDLRVFHEALAKLWENGAEPSWPADDGRRTVLPTYPFQRKRFWIDLAEDRPPRPRTPPRRDPADWFYGPVWRSAAGVRRPSEPRDVILVGAAGEFAQALAAKLTNPADLAGALAGVTTASVVFDGRSASAADLLHVTRTLAACDARIQLLVLTGGAFDVSGDEPIVPAQAILAGIGKVIPKELGHVSSRVVDVDPRTDPADDVRRELDEAPGDVVVAYRTGRRWRQDVERLRLPTVDTPLREHGVYLITGGLGGLGRSLAIFLAREYKARLVLSGRTISGADLPAIEAAGGEVITVPCDVTDPAAVRALVKESVARFGDLHGVLHLAGHGGNGKLIEDLDPAEFHASIAPKVTGADAILAATEDVDLDFLALFSSLSTVDSWDGAADYTAGNAYLDALAHHARRQGRAEVMAIDWTGWLRTGMNADDQTADTAEYLTEAEGHAAFVAALTTGLPQLHVAVHDLAQTLRQARQFVTRSEPPRAVAAAASSGPVEARVGAAFERVLGVEWIGPDDNFFVLGGNSLLALEVVGQVRREYDVKILLRDFFSTPTIRGLADLARHHDQEDTSR
jgi:phthiocerol/phenolphthiocerol synthesis type-I polyketide synthase E